MKNKLQGIAGLILVLIVGWWNLEKTEPTKDNKATVEYIQYQTDMKKNIIPTDKEKGLKSCKYGVYERVGDSWVLNRYAGDPAYVNDAGDTFTVKASYFNVQSGLNTVYLKNGNDYVEKSQSGQYELQRLRQQGKLNYSVYVGKSAYLIRDCKKVN